MYLRQTFSSVLHWPALRPTLFRWVLAGPVALVVAVLFMASMPTLLPPGRGGVDHFVLPVILFPLIWAIAVLYPVMTEHLGRATLVFCAVLAAEIAIVAKALL
ncbi:MAG: hypothetical protein AAGB05_03990 [Pseudomonadota bacterium]